MDIKKVDTAAVSPNDEKADRTDQTGDIYTDPHQKSSTN